MNCLSGEKRKDPGRHEFLHMLGNGEPRLALAHRQEGEQCELLGTASTGQRGEACLNCGRGAFGFQVNPWYHDSSETHNRGYRPMRKRRGEKSWKLISCDEAMGVPWILRGAKFLFVIIMPHRWLASAFAFPFIFGKAPLTNSIVAKLSIF